jgi:hypothetical protein
MHGQSPTKCAFFYDMDQRVTNCCSWMKHSAWFLQILWWNW